MVDGEAPEEIQVASPSIILQARKPFALALSSTLLLITLAACKHAPSPDVMATVNGKDILRSDLDKAYNNYKATQGDAPQDPNPEQANIVRLNLLRQLIDNEILDQTAAKLNLSGLRRRRECPVD